MILLRAFFKVEVFKYVGAVFQDIGSIFRLAF